MESKRKSFFNEIGFKPTIEKLVDLTAKLYLEDDNPWVVGYSGGKDSSACLQLMWRVLEKIKSEKHEIIDAIQSSGKLEENTEKLLVQAIEEYKKANK